MIVMQSSKVQHIMSNTEEIHELTFELGQKLLINIETNSKHNHNIENLNKKANFAESKTSVTQVTIQQSAYLSGQVHWNGCSLSS